MNLIRYGATPAHIHVRQIEHPLLEQNLSTTGIEELKHILEFVPESLPEEKIKISWEIENGK